MSIKLNGGSCPHGSERSKAGGGQWSNLPGPKGIPLIGNLLQLDLKRLHKVLEGWADDYGELYTMRLGRRQVLVVSDPDLINDALRNRPEGYRRLGTIESVQNEMGVGGVFSAEGERWRRQRQMVNQTFNPKHLRQFYSTAVAITDKLKKRLSKYADSGDDVSVQNDLMRYTVDITTNLAFGYDVNTLESDGDVIQGHLEKIFPMIPRRVNAPFPSWRFIRLPADRALEKALEEIKKAIAGFVVHSRNRIANNPLLEEQPSNLLEAMLVARDQTQARFSDQEITGNVLTMLLAGEDTTANTMAWMLYFMAENSDVQRRMQSEVDQVLGQDTLLDDYESHTLLTYTEAVAFEAMRLKSVAPLLFLETNYALKLGDMELTAGTPLFLLLRQCALQDSAFAQADRFNPDRWLNPNNSNASTHNTSACLPFGAGSRFCPGRGLAMLEIKSVMAMLCRNFEFTRPAGSLPVDEEFAFVMAPNNLRVKICKRTATANKF